MRKSILVNLILSLTVSTAFVTHSFAQSNIPLSFRHYNVSNGLSNNIVYYILQDHLGQMWFGTEDGLNAFDGYQFYQYKYNPSDSFSISNSIVRCMYEDGDNLLWIGTEAGLNSYNPVTGKFTRYKNNLPDSLNIASKEITSIGEDASGIIWIGTDAGLFSFDKKNNQFKHYGLVNANLSGQGNFISAMLVDKKNNTIWIATRENKLYTFNWQTGKFTLYKNISGEEPLGENYITCLYKDKSGTLWMGTLNEGLMELDAGSEQPVRYRSNPSQANSLSQNSVFTVCEDENGQLWVGTLGGGLNIFNKNEKKFFSYQTDSKDEESLSSNSVWSVFIDKAGTAWIGTSTGLSTYDKNRKKFSTIQVDAGNSPYTNNNVYSIYKDHENNLWIGIQGGGLYQYDIKTGKVVASYKNIPGNANSLSDNHVFCILEDHKGILWIGTYNGLNAFDKTQKRFTVYRNNPADSFPVSNNYITSLVEDEKGALWIGTFGGGLNRLNSSDGKFYHYRIGNNSSPNNNIVSCLFRDDNNVLWVGTYGNGLNKFNQASGAFTAYKNNPQDNNSISSNYIYCINEDKKGALWIGTYGAGLNEMTDKTSGKFERFNQTSGLPNNIITSIQVDDKNHLWLSTNNGIVEFAAADMEEKAGFPLIRLFDEQDGLQYKYNPGAGFKTADGEIYFGGINGFNGFYPDKIINNPNKPPVIITRFKIFDKDFPLDSAISQKHEITLTYTQKFFSFEFAGLNYAFPEKNKYAYKLEGFDKDWIESGNRRYAAYTNLDHGTYIFHVKSSNNDGVWNEEGASLKIIILPPFWQTWWFYLIVGCAFVLSVILFIRLRTRSLRVHAKQMEMMVQKRTHELQTEKEKTEQKSLEIEQTLQHLKATQEQLIQSEKMASLGVLTAGIAHEIKNPLNFVNNFSQISTELIDELNDSNNEEEKKEVLNNLKSNLEKITYHGKRADSIVRNMLDHSRTGSKDMRPTDINWLCEEYLNLAYHGMKANVPEFNCEIKKELATNLPKINIVSQEISRVLLNLFNNAFYVVNEKSKTTANYKPLVTLITTKGKDTIIIRMRDNGFGIQDNLKEKIFEPFFTTKPAGQGTGLGLSLSYDIIKSHGGNLTVKSEQDNFTEFEITLPIE